MRTSSKALFTLTITTIALTLAACGRSASTSAATPASGDACSLLSIEEVRAMLPEVKSAKRNDDLVAQGIASCEWRDAAGKRVLLGLRTWKQDGADDTPTDNAETLAMGMTDPLRGEAQGAVRMEKMPSVGDDAVAFVEKADSAKGILSQGSLLVVRKGDQLVLLLSSALAGHERSAALRELSTLGKSALRRL
jgi:hypothetical protein